VGCKNARERVVADLGFPPEMGLGRMGLPTGLGFCLAMWESSPYFFLSLFLNLDLCPIIFSKHCCGFFLACMNKTLEVTLKRK
jgi:hypothetical protein